MTPLCRTQFIYDGTREKYFRRASTVLASVDRLFCDEMTLLYPAAFMELKLAPTRMASRRDRTIDIIYDMRVKCCSVMHSGDRQQEKKVCLATRRESMRGKLNYISIRVC